MKDYPLVIAAKVNDTTLYYDHEMYQRPWRAVKMEETVNFGRGVTVRYWCGSCNKQVKTEWVYCPYCGRRFG